VKNFRSLQSIKFDLFITTDPSLIKELRLKGFFRFDHHIWIKKSGGSDYSKSQIKLVKFYENSIYFQIKFKEITHNKKITTFLVNKQIYSNLVIL
jgi:hypothetical protein